MPRKLVWTDAQDMQIRRYRAEGASWDTIAAILGVTRWTAIERARRLGVRSPLPGTIPSEPDPDRPAMPAGAPNTWGAITRGTVLEGLLYPIPGAVR